MTPSVTVLELDPRASLWVETLCPACNTLSEFYADLVDCRQVTPGETEANIKLTCDCSHEWVMKAKVKLSITPF